MAGLNIVHFRDSAAATAGVISGTFAAHRDQNRETRQIIRADQGVARRA
jgi:hypothetical protein